MSEIAKIFSDTFRHWQIVLPNDAVETRQRGEIHTAGWTIQYLFGQDEKGGYLDYYATHRMTNERHVRIYDNGVVVTLEAPLEFMVFPPNCTQEEAERIRREYTEANRQIYAALAQKGFV